MESTGLARFPWLVHGFSVRYARSGSAGTSRRPRAREFNLGFTPAANRGEVERNRRRFLRALDAGAVPASLHQIHSAAVWEVSLTGNSAEHGALRYLPASNPPSAAHESRNEPAGDALITSEAGILLTIRTADCLPVLIVDTELRVVAAVHAGWRGALARVIEKTVGEMRRISASRPENLFAVLGPAIGRCCYEVGEEVVDAFRGQFRGSDVFFHKPTTEAEPQRSDLRYTLLFHTQAPPGHRREPHGLHLDLTAVARAQLLASGVRPSAIHASEYCTACHPELFFSHRRDGARASRMMAAIGVRA